MLKSGFFGLLTVLFMVGEARAQVDLSGSQNESMGRNKAKASKEMSDKQWFERWKLESVFAVGTLTTRGTGSLQTSDQNDQDGHAYVDGLLFINGDVWDDVNVFVELGITGGRSPWFHNNGKVTNTECESDASTTNDDCAKGSTHSPIKLGESYLEFKNVLKFWGDDLLGIKVGNFELPFGEEYLWHDKWDNPTIFRTAGWVWGRDEGILLYGKAGPVGWKLSATDNYFLSDKDEYPSKAYTAKVSSDIHENLFVSASYMQSGSYSLPSIWAGNNLFPTAAGGSVTDKFDGWEIDLVFKAFSNSLVLSGFYGQGSAKALNNSANDREFKWYMIQPQYWVTDSFYVVGRYSFYGADKAVFLDGQPYLDFTDLQPTFTAWLNEKTRSQVGVGYKMNPNTVVKLDYAIDNFKKPGDTTAPAGMADVSDSSRTLIGLEVATKF